MAVDARLRGDISGAAQHDIDALTAPNTSTVDGTYGAEEQAVINNTRNRVNNIEPALRAAGIIP